MPSALFRSAPSEKVVITIDKAAGAMTAAPKPWIARAATSISADHASPHSSDEAVKTATPRMKTRRRPSRSAARPQNSMKPPKVRAYAIVTHWTLPAAKSRSFTMDGIAVSTIVPSRMTMKNAVPSNARAFQRRGSGTGSSGPADSTVSPIRSRSIGLPPTG
jgi:hypothetical protein